MIQLIHHYAFYCTFLLYNVAWVWPLHGQISTVQIKKEKQTSKDSLSLKQALLNARWDVNTRTFMMSTHNQGPSNDAYAVAFGAGLGVLTQSINGWQAGISGFFITKLLSSNLQQPEPSGTLPNRYEAGLFDIQNMTNANALPRLESFFIKYNHKNSAVVIGKMNLNTPFFNPQDGRMRPTLVEGVWLNSRESKKFNWSGGWIWGVSPRSTVKWYSLSNSIGIFPMGTSVNGQRSNYAGNIQGCSGMAITNISYLPNRFMKIDVWNGFLENVMNTALIEARYEKKLEDKVWYSGFIFLHQNAVHNGGNANPEKTYYEKGSQANALSAQYGFNNGKWNTNINYTHITGDGRYLMPREWGREVFYTFLSRERNEGMGKVHAAMVRTTYSTTNKRLQSSLAYGYYVLPDVRDARYNKYGLPSYHQINLEVNHAFKGFLKGTELRFLAAYKINAGQTYGDLKYQFNKVDMLNLNVIVDFKL